MKMKLGCSFFLALLSLVYRAVLVTAFQLRHNHHLYHPSGSTQIGGSVSSEEVEQRALALSDYLAKAHEEKLRAIQDVEKRKAAEIEALKNEIAALQQHPQQPHQSQQDEKKAIASTSSTSNAGAMVMMTGPGSAGFGAGAVDELLLGLSKEELVTKVLQYRQFMEKYIVQAQEQKVNAVKLAENSLKQKIQEQYGIVLMQPQSPTAAAAAAAAPPVTAASTSTSPLYQARNAAVAAAASAGKSRWGDLEVQKASTSTTTTAPTPTSGQQEKSLSLAERISKGVNAGVIAVAQAAQAAPAAASVAVSSSSSAPTTTTMTMPSTLSSLLYQKRNSRVLASAAAGKSRWGPQELARIEQIVQQQEQQQSLSSTSSSIPAPIPPEVIAADHGLRSDGTVGGWTLAERVAQGASAGGDASSSSSSSSSLLLVSPYYQSRNVRVLEAAAAGLSRWGDAEIEKVKSFLASGESSSSFSSSAGGRVNVGAQILGGAIA